MCICKNFTFSIKFNQNLDNRFLGYFSSDFGTPICLHCHGIDSGKKTFSKDRRTEYRLQYYNLNLLTVIVGIEAKYKF